MSDPVLIRRSVRGGFSRGLMIGLMTLFGSPAEAQSILTVAGGGSDDWRQATQASLSFPTGVALGPEGDLYIADAGTHRIRRVVAASGIMLTIAGNGRAGFSGDGGLATEASLGDPTGVAVDSSGNVFVVDRLNDRIRRVDATTGIITTIAGNGTGGFSGDQGPAVDASLRSPSGIALDAGGNLYIADRANHRVRRVDATTGVITTIAGAGPRGFAGDDGPAIHALLADPWGVAIDGGGNLYIADRGNHRVRRIDSGTGNIMTIGGNGAPEFGGDGGPAIEASLNLPIGVATGPEGDVYIADRGNNRVRRIDIDTGLITTVAGDGGRGFSGDGGPATEASLTVPNGVAVDALANLYVADRGNHRVRRIESQTRTISTIAGDGGTFATGDGGPARRAVLNSPSGVAADHEGHLFIADRLNHRIRHVDSGTGIISTVVGDGIDGFGGDGGPATEASLNSPTAAAIDPSGILYVADRLNDRIRRIDLTTGLITTIAGNGIRDFAGDGGLATEASLATPTSLATWQDRFLYIADSGNNRVRRLAFDTGVITTVAGNGNAAFVGDGGPATAASLNDPRDLSFDQNGNLYVADSGNHAIRRIESATGIISTVAGNGVAGDDGDGLAATGAQLRDPWSVAVGSDGHVYITDSGNHRLRRIDSNTGLITSIAGRGTPGSTGDSGPAVEASLFDPRGLAFHGGDLYIADRGSNRVRAIFECVDVNVPELLSPLKGATELDASVILSWSDTDGTFSYDVLLDTVSPPTAVVASDSSSQLFTAQNLNPNETYYWRVVANGDPFCEPKRTASSEIRSFQTRDTCGQPRQLSLSEPADEANTSTSLTLTWTASEDVKTFDLFLGTTNPPPHYRSTREAFLPVANLIEGTTYYWQVVAHSACDASRKARSSLRRFTVVGDCRTPESFALKIPANGATNVATSTRLEWALSNGATSYDFFFGETNPPPVFLPDVESNRLDISGLAPDTTYYWQVAARVACKPENTLDSRIATFTTESFCSTPASPTIVFQPPGAVGLNEAYTIGWSDAPNARADAVYAIDRATDPQFTNVVSTQETNSNFASFMADGSGRFYHRVRAANGCSTFGPASSSVSVDIVQQRSSVIFSVEPEAVLTAVGQKLEDAKSRFVLENLAEDPVTVAISQARLGSPPFFDIVDPLGGESVFVTLESRKPKAFELHFSGPSNENAASYQGLVFLTAPNSPIIPYAFVNLKVGNNGQVAPLIHVAGTTVEYASFSPFAGSDDTNRPPLTVQIHNPGSIPIEVGAEVGPEVWLEPEPGWNDHPIPAGGSRTVSLRTKRKRAPNGAPFPRYTYFKVRTKSGESARLLVQDNEIAPIAPGRTQLQPAQRAWIIPHVTGGDTIVSRITLTNLGGQAVPVEVVFTPEGTDGFSTGVQTAVVVLPPHDVVKLTDPLRQVFGFASPVEGQIEIRNEDEGLALVRPQSSNVRRARAEISLGSIPVIERRSGARIGEVQVVDGIARNSSVRSDLVLIESSGVDAMTATIRLLDSSGASLGSDTVQLGRYGTIRLEDVVQRFGVSTIAAGRVEIQPSRGSGTIRALALVIDKASESFTASVSNEIDGVGSNQLTSSSSGMPSVAPRTLTSSLVIPYVLTGTIGGKPHRTVVGFVAAFSSSTMFHLKYRRVDGVTLDRDVSIAAGATVEYADILRDVFGLSGTSRGALYVTSSLAGRVYSKVIAGEAPAGIIPTIPTSGELIASTNRRNRPLFLDGLTQSRDPQKGTRWSLVLNEVEGEAGSVRVSLYESTNRSHPIARRDIMIGRYGQVELETIFSELGLDTTLRQKDRVNVLCVVQPISGKAAITASAIAVDSGTGRIEIHNLEPAGGSGTSVTTDLVKVTLPDLPEQPGRRRPVGRRD